MDFNAVTDPHVREMLFQMSVFITIIAPITVAVVEMIKMTFTHIPNQYYTVITIATAISIAFLGYIFTDLPAVYRVWAGLFAGLSAAKLYDIGKNIVKPDEKG